MRSSNLRSPYLGLIIFNPLNMIPLSPNRLSVNEFTRAYSLLQSSGYLCYNIKHSISRIITSFVHDCSKSQKVRKYTQRRNTYLCWLVGGMKLYIYRVEHDRGDRKLLDRILSDEDVKCRYSYYIQYAASYYDNFYEGFRPLQKNLVIHSTS